MADSHELSSRAEWQNIERFADFAQDRALVKDATKQVIDAIVEQYVDPAYSILELGSGLGELSRILGERYKSRVIEVEQASRALQKRLSDVSPEIPRLIQGSILHLPIADSTQHNVVSLSAFDTIDDLSGASSEVARVLQPGGHFIHILDLIPHGEVIMRHLPQDQIPFPAAAKEGQTEYLNGFVLFPRTAYPLLRRSLDPNRIPIYDQYASDPIGIYLLLHEKAQDLAYKMAHDVDKYLKTLRIAGIKRTGPLHSLFGQRLSVSLQEAGLEIIENHEMTGEVTVSKGIAHFQYPDKNVFFNRTGRNFQRFDAFIPRSQVKQVSTLHVVVARKI